tara:strand:- start:1151 stop:2617 length:1467 start_codon:yes stop_codon:yes gene_type:complete
MNNMSFTACLKEIGRSAQSILTEKKDKLPYETGARREKGQAILVLRPATNEEMSDMVAVCVKWGVDIIPQSGNTGVVWGSTPDETGDQVLLSLDRMRAVFELDIVNRSLRVGAGIRLSELNAKLQEHGLFFPIDLGADPMIGGMISTNTGGSRFLRYGDVRANTLGLKVVLGDQEGTVLDLMSSLRKNNVGVDWKHVFIGTSGAFGIVTEAVLSLEPLPQQTAVALLLPNALTSVPLILIEAERQLGPQLSAFEYMSGNAMGATLAHVSSIRNPFSGLELPDFAILIEITRPWKSRQGEATLNQVLEDFLVKLWQHSDSPLRNALPASPEDVWPLRHSISEGVRTAGYLIAFDLAFERGRLLEFLAYTRTEIPKRFPNVRIFDFGHLGDGGVHFNLIVALDDFHGEFEPIEAEIRDWVIDTCVTKFEGSFSGEHGIGRKNQKYYNKYSPKLITQIGTDLKKALSPGRLGVPRFHKYLGENRETNSEQQ